MKAPILCKSKLQASLAVAWGSDGWFRSLRSAQGESYWYYCYYRALNNYLYFGGSLL